MTHINTLIFIVLCYMTGCICQDLTRCTGFDLKSSNFSEKVENILSVEYYCPREFDPKSFTECCPNGGCCESSLLSLAPNDSWLLMVTSILVIGTCIILTILVVVCCFWSKCPLYNTCKANYNMSNVIVYSLGKDDPTPLMPAEANQGSQYHPCTVKIKKVQEV